MKNYDPNITNGVHTIKITLQQWGYVGHITKKIYGNCKGVDVLNFDFYDESDSIGENDCDIKYDEDKDLFQCILKNSAGEELKCEFDACDMNKMVVAIEITDFREEKE